MMPPELELRLYRFLDALEARLGSSRDPEAIARAALRAAIEFADAGAGCLAAIDAGAREARVLTSFPAAQAWDLELLARFARRERPPIVPGLLLAPLYRRRRTWQVLALERHEGFAPGTGRALGRVARTVSRLVAEVDRERLDEVRARIERKIIEQLRPQDLFYQILHGLRSLTGYDHSSALFIAGEREDVLQLAAEQIAWRKAKSRRIGLRLGLPKEVRAAMAEGGVRTFEREGRAWRETSGAGTAALAELLDSADDDAAADEPSASAMLCAPLVTREGVVGALKVASVHGGSLGPYETELVAAFLPQAAVAVHNSRRAEYLEARMLAAEKKHAMADLARGVAHDVNNALGAVLPRVQQLRQDTLAGPLDAHLLEQDLGEIERSLQSCKRIFGGMLAFARGAGRGRGKGDVRRAIDGALNLLRDGLKRRQVEVAIDVPADLPAVRAGQADLERVLFNLMGNARDAMPQGGRLTIGAARDGERVRVWVEDTGTGIAARDLERVHEPFFTTKAQGHGLGLAVCRSILWEVKGDLTIASREGQGTRVEIVVPPSERRQEARV
jgi:two-component system, NtrC family, sensor kinase